MTATSTVETCRAEIPPPEDVAYPGTIAIHVDASDTTQGIFRVHETIPVEPGRLTLLYPKWIPGDHAPSGPIAMLAGLNVSADGDTLTWTRDKYDVYAFHVEVPDGVTAVEVDFQYLSPRRGDFEMTDRMLMLEWDKMSLYPAGYYSRGIAFEASISLSPDWQFGTALEPVSQSNNTTTFKPVSHDTLVDSPIYAGRYFNRVDLNPDGDAPVQLNVVADAPKYLEMTPEQLNMHRALVAQMLKLFDSHHFDHYDFLFSLSDHLAGNGLEHHRSSENGLHADYFKAWDDNAPSRDLLAHEFEHSWNGKFRRPADLWTPNFNVPMGDSLLWVYEGMTQYWGFVITARAGLWTPEQFREALALVAGNYDRNRPGLGWRPLVDTTNDPTTAHRSPLPYRSWQMSEEYYSGGQMLWLAVDAKIRALTQGAKSLDDFARAFCGMDNGSFIPKTYTRNDVIATLNDVAEYDWPSFLQPFVDECNPPLLAGLAASGWKLVYTAEQGEYQKQHEKRRKSPRHAFNFAWSIGLTLTRHGRIHDVRWDGPAFRAGASTGATVKAVNGQSYSKDAMQQAIIEAAGDNKAPIELLLKFQGGYRTLQVDYHGGLQYPHLARVDGEPDYLSDIIEPRQ